ncbi:MAG: TonB-dependent receptor [Novosphingobium sp.]
MLRRADARSSAAWSAMALALALGVSPAAAWAQTPPGEDQPPVEDAAGEQVNQSSQDTVVDDAAADEGVDTSQIVVTGTILRGAPPTGSNLISVGEERVASTGATTSNELLATVPQVSNLFNNVPNARLSVASNQIQVVRPNLRNLSNETSSTSSTLVLFDGHRIANVGVSQQAVDPDLIPTLAIERVEVVTDGGSATYGADAVGGVINFITRKRFDGVKVSARYGFADDYYQVDAGAIAGKDWGSGSLFAAYNYQHNDALFGRDRDFIRDVDFLSANLTPRGRQCSPGNVQVGTALFALPTLAAGANVCDPSDNNSVVPRSTRHGAIGGLHQELADWLTVDLRAFYGERKSTSLGVFTGAATVTPTSAFYMPVGTGAQRTSNQTVLFDLTPLLGLNSRPSTNEFQEWGANAEFKADLNDNWGLRVLFNYSRSNSEFHIQQANPTLTNGFGSAPLAANAINFYNPGAGPNDAANIARLINNENAGQGRDAQFNTRAIVDGSLFSLPGGDVKLAVGYEYLHDDFQQRVAIDIPPIGSIRSVPYSPYSRRINSAFGEVNVPIVGADNRSSFFHTLTLAGSVRYDHFSDFGSTTNPKVGVNFKPVNWLGFRGNYSTSFNAPSPVDQLGSLRNTATLFNFIAFTRPGDVPQVTGNVGLQGSTADLLPQTAKTYSFGIDIDPPFLEGLHASANYYNVKFKNIIRQPSPNVQIFGLFPNNIISSPTGITITQLTNFLNNSGATNAAQTLAASLGRCSTVTGLCNIYELTDFRQSNYGRVNVEGIDFTANYRTSTSFGGIDLGLSGNYQLKRESQTGPGAPFIDELDAQILPFQNGTLLIPFNAASRLQLQASAGVDIGDFRAQATLNHNAGFDVIRCDPTTIPVCNPNPLTITPTTNGLPQDRVGAFNTVNLFFKYSVPGDSFLLRDLEFTLNINNVFDEDPPIFRSINNSQPGYANGFTLGRLVQFGISKKF